MELDGERSANLVAAPAPEFYFRLAYNERFGIFKLAPKKNARVVQKWHIIPVTNETVEEQEEVPVLRQQIDEGLYKIWPKEPLKPGEYAVVEYTVGQRNIQIWDFAYRPAGKAVDHPNELAWVNAWTVDATVGRPDGAGRPACSSDSQTEARCRETGRGQTGGSQTGRRETDARLRAGTGHRRGEDPLHPWPLHVCLPFSVRLVSQRIRNR